jgi:hypothetical protein
LLASRDGLLLESISITKQVSPYPQKEADAQELSAKVAELEIARIKSQDRFTALAAVQNGSAEISGHEGFSLRVSFKNARGLEIRQVVYGFVDHTEYYQLSFQAPMLYYFDRYYPDFQKAVESFQLVAAKR